jgi:hypothetical protein
LKSHLEGPPLFSISRPNNIESVIQSDRIDQLLPAFDFRTGYEICINAPRASVYECLLHLDFSELWLTRVLMTVRSGKWMPRNPAPRDLRQRFLGTGFVILEEVPNEELVIGVAGRFWRPDGGRFMELTPSNFQEFSRTGWTKAAWNFKLTTESANSQSTLLSTETRIQCLGRAARWKFGAYWSLVGPFFGTDPEGTSKTRQVKSRSEPYS